MSIIAEIENALYDRARQEPDFFEKLMVLADRETFYNIRRNQRTWDVYGSNYVSGQFMIRGCKGMLASLDDGVRFMIVKA